jgi:hypothetical protein
MTELTFAKKRLTHATLNRLAESGQYFCQRCQQVKPIAEFMSKSSSKNGVRSPCKQCWKVYEKERNATPKRKQLFATRQRPLGQPAAIPFKRRTQDPKVIRGLYLIQMGDIYKIGRSTNVHKRVADIRGSLPFKSALIHVIPVGGSLSAAEHQLHLRFKHCWSNGEWFHLIPEDVRTICAISSI